MISYNLGFIIDKMTFDEIENDHGIPNWKKHIWDQN